MGGDDTALSDVVCRSRPIPSFADDGFLHRSPNRHPVRRGISTPQQGFFYRPVGSNRRPPVVVNRSGLTGYR